MARIERDSNGKIILTDLWHIIDVIEAGENIGYLVTEDQAEAILYDIAHYYDAEVGINWDVINNSIEDFMTEKGIQPACKYCGGNCPNDHDYACDGFLGDVDELYDEVTA